MNLNVKLALYISFLACLCASLISAVSYSKVRTSIETQINANIVSLVDTVYNTAAAAVYVENTDLANEVIHGLMSNEIIHCVSINSLIGQNQFSALGQCEGAASYKRELVSPFDADDLLGEIRIFMDDTVISHMTNERAVHEAKVTATIILTAVALAFFVTYLSITTPIHSLSVDLEKIDLAAETPPKLSSSNRKDEIGTISKVINLLITNASEQIKREKLLVMQTQLSTNNFKMTFELSKTAIAVIDNTFTITSLNPAFKALFSEKIDCSCSEFRKSWMSYLLAKENKAIDMIGHISDIDRPETVELDLQNATYLTYANHTFSFTVIKTKDALEQVNYLIFMDDITEQKRKLEATELQANLDQLTGLLNRRGGHRSISHALSSLQAHETMAIMVLDLDGFKGINDEHGHEAGDVILKAVSARLRGVTRGSDVVSRWGGDEFVLGLVNVNQEQAVAIGHKIVASISQPIAYKHIQLNIGVSIGIALSSSTVANFSELFDGADKAMYDVKKTGKNGVAFLKAS